MVNELSVFTFSSMEDEAPSMCLLASDSCNNTHTGKVTLLNGNLTAHVYTTKMPTSNAGHPSMLPIPKSHRKTHSVNASQSLHANTTKARVQADTL